jgi:hypothetical protein
MQSVHQAFDGALQRRLLASASMPRTVAIASFRSASAVSTAAFLTATAVRYDSLSSSASGSPRCTRLLSSTRTRAT